MSRFVSVNIYLYRRFCSSRPQINQLACHHAVREGYLVHVRV